MPHALSKPAASSRTRGFVRLSSVTAVDWHPAEPRFEVVYHLHSIEPNPRLRLKCRCAGDNPEIDSVTSVWRAANWYEREVFDLFGIRFRNHPESAPHPDARRLGRPSAAQGLSGSRVQVRLREGMSMKAVLRRSRSHDRRDRRKRRESGRTAPDDPEHGAAAPVDARRAAPRARTGRRDHRQGRAGHRLPAHRHRKAVRGHQLGSRWSR